MLHYTAAGLWQIIVRAWLPRMACNCYAARMRHTRLCVWAILLLLIAAPASAWAGQLSGLVVDQDGFGIADARIEFLDAAKHVTGHAKTDRAGRFTLGAGTAPAAWTIRAAGFAARTLPFEPSHPVAVLYPPLISNPRTSAADLAVLPYQDAGYAFALEPFTVIQGGSSVAVGDRGLSGSANALENNGSTFENIPAQYLSFAGVSRSFQSYRYSNGAAGEYTTGFDRSAGSSAQAGAGSLAIQNVFGAFSGGGFGIGNSSGDLTQRSRADFIAREKAGAGNLLFTLGSSFFSDQTGATVATQRENRLRLRLDEPWNSATAILEAEGKSSTKIKVASYTEPQSQMKLKLRVRKNAGSNIFEYGALAQRDTGERLYASKEYDGTGVEERLFVSDSYQWRRVNADASVAAYALNFGGATHHVPTGLWQTTGGLSETLAMQWNVSERWMLEVTGGDIIDTPSVSGQYFGDPVPPLELNRSRMVQADLRYELPGGFTAALTQYSERYTTVMPQTALSGTGIAVDWPFAKRWRLRAWTLALRDTAASAPSTVLQPSAGRDVAWLSYLGDGLRLDAIYRRETDVFEYGRYLDADAALRVTPKLSLIGTMEHHRYWSSYGISLRVDNQ